MKRTLLAFSIATMALTTTADHLIVVKVGGKSFAAKVEDTATGRAFMEKLPLSLDMTELNGNEKYRYGVALPTAAQYFAKIEAGDLMLYGSNCLVLFYGAAGGYSYTRIGKLTSTDGLAKAVGNGAATVTFEKATLSASIRMEDGNTPCITAVTNLPAESAIMTLAAKDPSADKSEWKDYNLLSADEKQAYRFFRLVANVD